MPLRLPVSSPFTLIFAAAPRQIAAVIFAVFAARLAAERSATPIFIFHAFSLIRYSAVISPSLLFRRDYADFSSAVLSFARLSFSRDYLSRHFAADFAVCRH